jgi:hypothetical protein
MSAELVGSVEPRLFTAPLRPITPETSFGFRVVAWARTHIPSPLLPHQVFALAHAGELLPDGSPRFKTVLFLAGRQGGCKTTTAIVLALWRLLADDARLVVATSAQLENARELFHRTIDVGLESPAVADGIATVRRANGQEQITTTSGGRLRILATNDRAARGLSVDLALLDELRTHESHDAWAAISPTVLARPRSQLWAFSNAGTAKSVVLNGLRASALSGADPSLGLFEWSAPPGLPLDDPAGWRAAQPAMGRLFGPESIASALGTTPPAIFRQEYLCEYVEVSGTLFDMSAWAEEADRAGSLETLRDRVHAGLEVSPDQQHATLACAAVQPDGRARLEVVWAGSPRAARDELPALLARVRPTTLTVGPGAAAAILGPDLRGTRGYRIAKMAELADAAAALLEAVSSRRLTHDGSALLTEHVAGVQRLAAGAGFRLHRPAGHCDAAVAGSLAVWSARQAPAAPRLRLLTGTADPGAA